MNDGDHIHVRSNVDRDCRRLLQAVDPTPVWEEQGNRKVTRLVRFLRRGGEPAEGQPPVSRHGGAGFAGRFTYSVVNNGRTLRYGNASRQARILALGGEIRPVNAQYLTIPMAREAQNRRAKDFPGAFVLRTANGLFLARYETKGGILTFLFRLLKRVFIKPHPYGMEWDRVDNDALRASLERRVKKADQEKAL
ncbi:MAG: hypothetical protein FJ313_05005 [Gemmatimonadetes bacterium]|nr:hypothetical protein [Gemmatimonadota bacterium]